MLDKSKTYLIVGLGLLGGKYAQVLSQKGYNVTGITHSQSTLDYALQHGYIRAGKNADFEDLVREADCIIFGLYPTVLLDWVKQYGPLIRPGTMVTDVSGVKRGVVEPVQAALPEGVEFIASHPMAGRETSGIAHSAEVNFACCDIHLAVTKLLKCHIKCCCFSGTCRTCNVDHAIWCLKHFAKLFKMCLIHAKRLGICHHISRS